MDTLTAFRAKVLAYLGADCFMVPPNETATFAKAFAHDTAHAIEHGITVDACATGLIEEFLETDSGED